MYSVLAYQNNTISSQSVNKIPRPDVGSFQFVYFILERTRPTAYLIYSFSDKNTSLRHHHIVYTFDQVTSLGHFESMIVIKDPS